MSDMSHCDRPLSRNYVKCPDKNRDPEERERAEIHRPMEEGGVTESTNWSDCDSYYRAIQCGHRD